MICSIQPLSSCQENPAFQLHNWYYHYVLFLATEYIQVTSSSPSQLWYEGRKLFFPLLCHLLLLPSARWHCLLSPHCRGISRRFPLVLRVFLSKWLSNQSFMWEASCWHPEYMSQICPAPPSDPSAEELPVSNLLMGERVCVSNARSFSQMVCY